MADQKTGCTCGSGGHPRRCAKHPFSFDEHVASINFTDVLDDDNPEEPWPEHMAEVRRRYDAREKAHLAVMRHRNEEEEKLRASLSSVLDDWKRLAEKRGEQIAALREALRPFANLYEPDKDEECVTHYSGIPLDIVRNAARVYSATRSEKSGTEE